jgi:hypothetical protein
MVWRALPDSVSGSTASLHLPWRAPSPTDWRGPPDLAPDWMGPWRRPCSVFWRTESGRKLGPPLRSPGGSLGPMGDSRSRE